MDQWIICVCFSFFLTNFYHYVMEFNLYKYCYFSVEVRKLINCRGKCQGLSWTLTDKNVLDIIKIRVSSATKWPSTYLNQCTNLDQQ